MAVKIVVVGDVNGQLPQLFSKLTKLQAKNGFAFALIAGNLFSEDDEVVTNLLADRITIPLPSYFTIGTTPFPERIVKKLQSGEEVCDNLHFLGKRSTTKTSEGIKIVTLGGQLGSDLIDGISKDLCLPIHTMGDARSLNGANSADILLTASWPGSIRKGSKILIPDGVAEPEGRDHISELCTVLKPRYHFSASADFFFEREPFIHTPDGNDLGVRPITRFLSLAAHGNPLHQKSIYAFSLQASPDPNGTLPTGLTATPFGSRKHAQKRPLDQDPYARYDHSGRDGYRQKRGRGSNRPPPGPNECFFCLSNTNLATHLIVSIGDDSYLTTAKGPLTTAGTNATLGIGFPAHALIIPLSHSPTLAAIADDDNARAKTYAEMSRFKEALQSMIAKRSSNRLGAVTYEISKLGGVHTHWQFLPMSANLINKGLVEAAFRVEAENLSYPAFDSRDPGLGEKDGDFFRVWIWTPPNGELPQGSTRCLTLPFDDRIRFSLQYGRIVLAKLLQLENRVQWRDCAQSEAEEKTEVESFKEAFKEFDFTLSEA